MYIKLTNAHADHLYEPVVLRKDIIISVYPSEVVNVTTEHLEAVNKSKKPAELAREKLTVVFAGTHGSWYVKETVDQVFKMLK